MERRLARLTILYQADPKAIAEASCSIEWALKWPHHEDPTMRAERICEAHGLDDAGVRRAIEVALIRNGATRDDARALADLGLECLLAFVGRETEAA